MTKPSSTKPWMPFYIAEYLADTGHLNTTQHGAYCLLIMHYWRTGGLPDDDRQIANIAKLSLRIWQDIKPIIQDFFHDGWKHKRIDHELAHADDISGKRRASAQQKHNKSTANAPANADQKHTHAGAQPSPSQGQEETENRVTEAKASGGEPPTGAPVYTDQKHELWGEGVAILEQLGVGDRAARSNIGRWLRDTNNDVGAVLSAIQRARDQRIGAPIPWITQALGEVRGQSNRNTSGNSASGARPAATNPIVAGVARVAQRRMRIHDQRENADPGEPDAEYGSA